MGEGEGDDKMTRLKDRTVSFTDSSNTITLLCAFYDLITAFDSGELEDSNIVIDNLDWMIDEFFDGVKIAAPCMMAVNGKIPAGVAGLIEVMGHVYERRKEEARSK